MEGDEFQMIMETHVAEDEVGVDVDGSEGVEARDLTAVVGAPSILAELAQQPKYCTNEKTDWQCYK